MGLFASNGFVITYPVRSHVTRVTPRGGARAIGSARAVASPARVVAGAPAPSKASANADIVSIERSSGFAVGRRARECDARAPRRARGRRVCVVATRASRGRRDLRAGASRASARRDAKKINKERITGSSDARANAASSASVRARWTARSVSGENARAETRRDGRARREAAHDDARRRAREG
jgi:hypothetical protein